MKLKNITAAFSQNMVNGQPQGEPVIVKVFDSIENFKRKIELLPAYKEIKETHELFQEERKKIVTDILDKYNKGRKEKVEVVPREKMKEFIDRLDKLTDTECTLKTKLKFTQEEIKKSGIKISEIELIEEFINLAK